jgi:hypothetical protein
VQCIVGVSRAASSSYPGVVVDVTKLHPVLFPPHEPAIQNSNMCNYDIFLLPLVELGISTAVHVQVPAPVTNGPLGYNCVAN